MSIDSVPPTPLSPPARWATALLILALPFLLLHWTVPGLSSTTLGSDYQLYAPQHQMELLLSLRTGSFPLYAPGFAGGQSTAALTLGQIYHPQTWLAALLPSYRSGHALQTVTLLRLLSLALTHGLLFAALRSLRLGWFAAMLISAVAIYNLRMLDCFRYATVESYTAAVALCACMMHQSLRPSLRRWWLATFISTACLGFSGHPQMMYFGILSALAWLLLLPAVLHAISPADIRADWSERVRIWKQVAPPMALGLAAWSVYALPFYFEFLQHNSGRIDRSYSWSNNYLDTIAGSVHNFVVPLYSDVHGAFGGSTLLLIGLLTPLLLLTRRRLPAGVWALWVLCLLILAYAQGARLPLHRWVWEYVPFAAAFRGPGRSTLVLPFFLAMLLAWYWRAAACEPVSVQPDNDSSNQERPLCQWCRLTPVFAAVIALPGLFIWLRDTGQFSPYSPWHIRSVPSAVAPTLVVCGLIALFALACVLAWPQRRRFAGPLLVAVTLLQIGLILYFGTWVDSWPKQPTFAQLLAQKKKSLSYSGITGNGLLTRTIARQLDQSTLEPRLAQLFDQVMWVPDQDAAYAQLAAGRSPDTAVLVGSPPALPLPEHASFDGDMQVQLVYASFNRINLKIVTPRAAYLGVNYPVSAAWRAIVNDQPADIFAANGAAQAVAVPAGVSRVEFRYWSGPANVGMLITCAALAIALLWMARRSHSPRHAQVGMVLALLLPTLLYVAWRSSLYRGANLGTQYRWTSSDRPPAGNLALFRNTASSSTLFPEMPHLGNSGRAVDGVTTARTGFLTNIEDEPTWSIDLHAPTWIDRLVLFEGRTDPRVNVRPIRVQASPDGEHWQTIATIEQPRQSAKLHLHLQVQTRHLRLVGSRGILAFDEVQLFAPGTPADGQGP